MRDEEDALKEISISLSAKLSEEARASSESLSLELAKDAQWMPGKVLVESHLHLGSDWNKKINLQKNKGQTKY